MSADNAMQVPLVELLARVPADARLVYEHSLIEHSFIPVGRYCNEAATALRAKDEEIARYKERERLYLSETCSLIGGRDGFVHACQREKQRADRLLALLREAREPLRGLCTWGDNKERHGALLARIDAETQPKGTEHG